MRGLVRCTIIIFLPLAVCVFEGLQLDARRALTGATQVRMVEIGILVVVVVVVVCLKVRMSIK